VFFLVVKRWGFWYTLPIQRVGEGGDNSSHWWAGEGGGVGGFGALPRWKHPLARELYCDHRYYATVPPQLVLIEV